MKNKEGSTENNILLPCLSWIMRIKLDESNSAFSGFCFIPFYCFRTEFGGWGELPVGKYGGERNPLFKKTGTNDVPAGVFPAL
jgi:hypothetical protein